MIQHALRTLLLFCLVGLVWVATPPPARAQQQELQPASIIREIQAPGERHEMMVHTSRILSLSPKLTPANRIPRVQVNNPDVLQAIPLSETQVQISAKKPGVTQVNLWDENGKVYAVDVIVYGDAQELAMILQQEFPNASIQVKPLSNGVLISGYVDQPDDVPSIIQIAEEYYPKVLNHLRVGGVQQVLLQVKVMEVSRTKLRSLGFEWTLITPHSVIQSGLGMFVDAATGPTFTFDVLKGNDEFLGVLDAMRKDNLVKILAEPNIVATSGRPSYFVVGGKFPYIKSIDNQGRTEIAWEPYGTRIDFVPFVLGNGRIRLEVRPSVSEMDESVMIQDIMPGVKERTVDTGVELDAGQTLAIAGLVQNRVEAERKGIPWVSDLPYAGALFRRVEEKNNEVELLVLVTPELVEAMDADEVPPCGPGMRTTSPTDWQLGVRGHIEVPACCPPGSPGTAPGPIMPPGQVLPHEPAAGSLPPAPLPDSASVGGGSSARLQRQSPSNRQSPQAATVTPRNPSELPGLMGPIGYDGAQ